MNVKPATKSDAEQLAQIGASTFYETFRPFNTEEDMQAYISKAYNLPLIQENLQNDAIHYAVAVEEERVIGYLKLLLKAQHPKLNGKIIELEKIYVEQAHHGTGAGFKLMQYAIEFSKRHEYTTLFLGVWKENERAVNFYRKTGFEVFDTRMFQLGTRMCEDYMMKLEL